MTKAPIAYSHLDSPIGTLLLARSDLGLHEIRFPHGDRPADPDVTWTRVDRPTGDAAEQLEAYFRGDLHRFSLALAPRGTPFQKAVWALLTEIPYGRTVTYGDLAKRLGNPKAVRAVGAANGRNPLPIVVPCHRVIGHDGTLTGYAGGLSVKAALLRLEGAAFTAPRTLEQASVPTLFDVH